jgi:hypothetical protein
MDPLIGQAHLIALSKIPVKVDDKVLTFGELIDMTYLGLGLTDVSSLPDEVVLLPFALAEGDGD